MLLMCVLAVCYIALQYIVAVHCSVSLQYVAAVCCSVLLQCLVAVLSMSLIGSDTVHRYMYRCRDGYKRVNGSWLEHAQHTGTRLEHMSSRGYYAAANPACTTIILEYALAPAQIVERETGGDAGVQAARGGASLTVYDCEDGGERRLCGM